MKEKERERESESEMRIKGKKKQSKQAFFQCQVVQSPPHTHTLREIFVKESRKGRGSMNFLSLRSY